jgi:hypothetical protein
VAFFTFTTSGFADFTLNLAASLRRHDPELARSLVVYCADDETARRLRAEGLTAVADDDAVLPTFASYDGAGFGRVVSRKFSIARSLLEQAEHVWWCDGDIVACDRLADRVLGLMDGADCDFLMQHEWPKDVFNTGFWLARRSPAVLEMLDELARHTEASDSDDQAFFNRRVRERGDVVVRALDHDEFMCGNRFFHTYLVRRPRTRLMHFNYSVGRTTKQELMVGHRCWYLPERRAERLRVRVRHVLTVVLIRAGVADPEDRINRAAGWVERRLAALGRLRPG